MAKRLLTLNVGASNIELAEYEAGAKGALTLLNYGVAALAAPLDGGDAELILTPALQDLARDRGIRPGAVGLAISGQLVFPRFAAIPMAGGAERFAQMVRYEIEQNVPFPIDEMVCDHQVLGDTESGDKSVMIVAAKVDQVESITAAVAAAGFSPALVDAAPLALTNALLGSGGEDACTVLLDVGSKTTTLVIIEGDKLYTRSIPVAGNAVTKEIATALGCSMEEAEKVKREHGYVSLGGVTEDEDETSERMAKACRAVMTRLNAEISRSINFYRSQQGGSAPTRLYLTGGTALLPQIDVFFRESLQMEVCFLDPFGGVAFGSKVDAAALESEGAVIATTVGIARHLAGTAHFAVNLLPPSLVEERVERARIPFVAAAGLCFVAALVALFLAVSRQGEVVAAQRDAVQTKVDSLVSWERRVKEAEGRLAAATQKADAMRGLLVARAATAQRVNAVRDSLLPGMWIERWDAGRLVVRYWSDAVKSLPGKTRGEVVVDRLKGRPCIDEKSVRISDMSAIGKDGQVEQFTVELKFK